MLKWSIVTKRETEKADPPHHLPPDSCVTNSKTVTPRKSKRRRSSIHRRRSSLQFNRNSLDALEADKENQFTSTPIKSSSENHHQFDPLRDVSNLTSKNTPSRIFSAKKCKSDKKRRHSSPKIQHKKKKSCLNPDHILNSDSQSSNYFRPFETVDSHIEGVLAEEVCCCKKDLSGVKKRVLDGYAPTLPNFAMDYSPCTLINTNCIEDIKKTSPCKSTPFTFIEDDQFPPNKKVKMDHVNDFLQQISLISPNDNCLKLPGLKLSSHKNSALKNEIKMSPLVKKFLDLKFSKISVDNSTKDICNDSSYINELSLDQIVDALLDSSEVDTNASKSLNTSIIVNIDSEKENFLNETHEDNIINSEQERKLSNNSFDGFSSDSGFRSSATENFHQLEGNFVCKCNNNIKDLGLDSNILCDKTIININETFNERCVDEVAVVNRKRASSTPFDCDVDNKRIHLEKSEDDPTIFTLRRQKCIRRRKTDDDSRKAGCTLTRTIETINKTSHDESFGLECSSPMRDCYLENKDIINDSSNIGTPTGETSRRIRRCITFDSPRIDEFSGLSESTSTTKSLITDVRGMMEVKFFEENSNLIVHVIRCKDLYRPNGKTLNAYVKVSVSDKTGESRRKRNGAIQRTAVYGDSTKPIFNHFFKFPVDRTNMQKRIHIEVCHRERSTRSSDFLGCMSFDIGHACNEGVSGLFSLLPQSLGRTKNVPITLEKPSVSKPVQTEQPKMCESHSSADEILSIDDDLKKTTNKATLSEQQKYADENLFLRYLELDPTEGPDAIPAATQRKASGNKNGRTPFTHTKKLTRSGKSGFGFSVVWTHPPRIERVEKGLPADKAGILPGDYIIFVDTHNVVTIPEVDILNLIKSYGSQLTLEIFRRNPSRNGSVPSVKRLVSTTTTTTGSTTGALPVTQSIPQRRPSTVCSTNTASADYNRRKLHLPQVTFSAERQVNNPEEIRKKSMYQLISKEQQYATAMQFAITRFVSALAERRDLITPAEHRTLFQNSEELLRLTEDILDHLVPEDGDPQVHLLLRTYQIKLTEITSAYKRYCSGIKKADCILVNKMKNSNSEFVRFIQIPSIPRRRPDLTAFIHKPLEHYREVLKLLLNIQSQTKPNHEEYAVINQVIHDLQLTYREITSEAGLMEPVGEGRPLLTVQDLENRLVFTKCKPFVLNKPGRQWIFGGDLSRIEGRNVRQYWTLLFSDLLLFAKVSRDRVLFIIEDPLPLAHVTEMFFNVRKKDTEFRITVSPEGRQAKSPTVHCGPDLSRTPRKNANKRTVILRAPTTELKAVWQNLLQRQIFQVNAGMEGSSFSSPLESPDAPITSSVATLQSADSFTYRRQTPQNINQNENKEIQRQIDALIEHKCKQLSKTNFNSKYNAIHLEKWIKGQLQEDVDRAELEPLSEDWTQEMLRKRSEELQLIDSQGNVTYPNDNGKRTESRCEEVLSDQDQSPTKTTSTESQVTVRSSPLVPETVSVCRQCHKNCIVANGNVQSFSDCISDSPAKTDSKISLEEDDWQPLLLLGLCAANPTATFLKIDPFAAPSVPKISVVPATPESSTKTNYSSTKGRDECDCQSVKPKVNDLDLTKNEIDISPDDSPQTEEHPYHSLSSSVATLRRFGTVSSLERVGSEEHEDAWENHLSTDSEDEEEPEPPQGIDNEAFNHSVIKHWTTRAGNFVAEKMTFFEKLGEDYRSANFFDKYLKSPDNLVNGDELQEDETSGATSGEEIWGTPTSGGELDDPLTSLNYDDKQSPNDGSISSENGDDTELMMDELLMTPPITGAIMRGLLPRRTLEPLIEEDCSETSSSPSRTSLPEQSTSPEQGNEIGDVADKCLPAVAKKNDESSANKPTQSINTTSEVVMKIHRSESYRRIIEAAENGEENDICFFNRFKPTAKFVNIERVPRTRSIKIFEFFNVHRPERRIYETSPDASQLLKSFCKESTESDGDSSSFSHKPVSPRRLKDKQLDRRFWKQLSRRRTNKINIPA